MYQQKKKTMSAQHFGNFCFLLHYIVDMTTRAHSKYEFISSMYLPLLFHPIGTFRAEDESKPPKLSKPSKKTDAEEKGIAEFYSK